jgi:hypothetical protein
MKKSIFATVIFLITLVSSTEFFAQKFPKMDISPMDASSYPSHYKISDKLVKVVYGRPQLKGRSLDKLAPKDEVWRTGANEATEITFYKDVTFGGKKVKAGTYTLFTIPKENNWTIILSIQKNVWGSYFYKETEDVVRVVGNISKSKESIDAFSIVFDGEEENVTMHLGWANTVVSVSLSSADSIPVKG